MPTSLPIFPSSLGTQMKKPESIFLLDAFATEKSNVLRTKPCRKDAAGKEEPPVSSFPWHCTGEPPVLPISMTHCTESTCQKPQGLTAKTLVLFPSEYSTEK